MNLTGYALLLCSLLCGGAGFAQLTGTQTAGSRLPGGQSSGAPSSGARLSGGQLSGTIKGRVIGQSTKRPIPGATVLIRSGGPGSRSRSRVANDGAGLPASSPDVSASRPANGGSGLPASRPDSPGLADKGAATDSSGSFTIRNIPAGSYTLVITSVGFQEKTLRDIIVAPDKTFYFETELAAGTDSLREAVVRAFKSEYTPLAPVSAYSFSREEIFRFPGSQGDIFRALGFLPGVSSSGGQFSAIAVRGQGTADNVYMVDDIPMFQVSHLEGSGAFNDPNGGRFSIFAPRVIDNAQFQGGGFAAQYGRKSSSYLGLGIKEGNAESPSLTGQFDLLGFSLIYDGPSYVDDHTSVLATARYQNFTLLEKVAGLKGVGLPEYGDYMIKTVSRLGARNKLEVLAMYNPERYVNTVADVRQVEPLQSTDLVDETNNKALFGLNLRTLTGRKSYWKNILYYRGLSSDANIGTCTPRIGAGGKIADPDSIPFEPALQTSRDYQHEWGYRSVFTQNFSSASFTAGVDLARVALDYTRTLQHTDTIYTFGPNDYRPDPSQYYLILQPSQFNARYNDFALNASAYADLSFVVWKRLHLNTGVRFDRTGFTQQSVFAPRVSGSLVLGGQSTINFATGIYYQDPEYDDVGDQPAGHRLRVERTIQYIAGYKKYFAQDLKFIAETWYKQFADQVTRPQSDQPYLTNAGTGYAYGLDLSLTKRLSDKYYGQVSYSYMLSKRDDHDGLGGYNFDFSQPEIVSLLLSYKPSDKWVFSAKFRYATGRPKDRFIIHSNVFGTADTTLLRYSQQLIGHNEGRLTDFISLDVRADYHVQYRRLSLTAFVDIVDLPDRFNQSGEDFQPLTGSTYYVGLAIFPSFGVIMGL